MPVDEFKIVSYQLTHCGRKKLNNEDWVASFEPDDPQDRMDSGSLYIVADGVGGGVSGEKASQYAAQKVLFEFYQSYDSDPAGRLLSAIQAANTDIFTYAQTHSSRPMGTTLVAASVCQDRLVVANVGDSRAYLIRSQQIEQLTHDHSLVQKLVDEHQITAEEARTSKQRNIILRSVGSNERVAVDTFRVELKEDDLVLLCSDGLHKYFADPQELAEAALDGPVELAAQRLIDLANERGGSDNISVILVRIGPRNSIPDDSEEEHAHRSNAGEQIKHKQRRSGIKPAPLILGILLALALLISAFFLVRSVSPSLFEPTNPTVPNSFDAGSMLPV